MRRHFLDAVAAAVFFVHVTAATSASCRGTGQQNIAFQMFLQLQTLRRHVSRPVAAGATIQQAHDQHLRYVQATHCGQFDSVYVPVDFKHCTWSEPATNGEVDRKGGVPGHEPPQASMTMATCRLYAPTSELGNIVEGNYGGEFLHTLLCFSHVVEKGKPWLLSAGPGTRSLEVKRTRLLIFCARLEVA